MDSSPATPAYFEVPYNLLLGSIFSLLSICSIVGNLFVLVIISRYKRLRTQTNLLLANLASIDLLTGLLAIPFSATTAFNGAWILGETACQINGFFNALFAAASIHTLMYIAVHKYLSLRSSSSSMMITASRLKQTVGMMAAAWIWGCVFASGLVTGWTSIEYKNGTTQCGPKVPDRGNIRELSHSLFTSISNYAIPFGVICFCYVSIFRTFRRSMETLKSDFQALSRRDYLCRQRKIVITLVIIFCSFLICLTPYICYSSTVAFFKDKSVVPTVLNPVAYIFLHLSSCINPVIYAFRSNEFAAAYKTIVKILCCEAPGMCLAKTNKTVPRLPPAGLRRRSLEAVRFLARKTQKMNQLHFEYRLSHSPSLSSQTSMSMWSMGRIPRRRSLSMWSTQGTTEEGLLTTQLAFTPPERDASPQTPRFAANKTTEPAAPRERLRVAAKRQKSTIHEENTSDLDSPTCKASMNDSGNPRDSV